MSMTPTTLPIADPSAGYPTAAAVHEACRRLDHLERNGQSHTDEARKINAALAKTPREVLRQGG